MALKTYEKKLLTHKNNIMAIHREIYILSMLDHEHIMKLFEVIDTREKCHLVMEHCHGRNLLQFVRKRPSKMLPEEEARYVFR